jgi:hypothetical protein
MASPTLDDEKELLKKEKRRISAARWRKANPEYWEQWYKANKEKAKETTARWHKANIEKIVPIKTVGENPILKNTMLRGRVGESLILINQTHLWRVGENLTLKK